MAATKPHNMPLNSDVMSADDVTRNQNMSAKSPMSDDSGVVIGGLLQLVCIILSYHIVSKIRLTVYHDLTYSTNHPNFSLSGPGLL